MTPSASRGRPPSPMSRSPSTSPPGCRTSSRPISRSSTKRPPPWTGPGSSCRHISPAWNPSPHSDRQNARDDGPENESRPDSEDPPEPARAGSPAMSTAHWRARRLPIPAAWPVRPSPAARPWAIISAGLAPTLLTGAYLIADILQPSSYSPVRTTISVVAGQAGTDRWVMTGGIVLTGGCYLVTAAGLTGIRASAHALLIVAGMAGIGIAPSPEPARGATPQHLACTMLGAVTITVWPAFAARRAAPRPLILSVCGSAAVTAVFAALLGWLLA